MKVEQLDLFADASEEPPLNGMYYERNSDKFVSFVLGKRYYEVAAKGCGLPADWQQKTKRERWI